MAQCASSVKSVSLELGGNAPLIVFNSSNIDQAVAGTLANKFRNTGQTCISNNRILVQRAVHDEFVEKFSSAVSQLVQGDPFNEASQQGALINEAAAEKVSYPQCVYARSCDGYVIQVDSHVTDAVSKGAEILVGGARNKELGPLFYRPSVAVGVSQDMKVTSEETFGPLAAIMRSVRAYDELV